MRHVHHVLREHILLRKDRLSVYHVMRVTINLTPVGLNVNPVPQVLTPKQGQQSVHHVLLVHLPMVTQARLNAQLVSREQ